jgi:hypothetical protein
MQVMAAANQLPHPDRYDEEMITIALVHHPLAWLNGNEQNSYGDRKNTYRYLCDRSHLILSGHVHGAVERPSRQFNRAWVCNGGATYADSSYRNNFSILQIDAHDRAFRRMPFEFDPRNDIWRPIPDDTIYSLSSLTGSTVYVPLGSGAGSYSYSGLAAKAKQFAVRYVEQKSQAITQGHKIPATIRWDGRVRPV